MKTKLLIWILILSVFLNSIVFASYNLDLRGQTISISGNFSGYDNIYLDGATITANNTHKYLNFQAKYKITANSSTYINGIGQGGSGGGACSGSFGNGNTGNAGQWGSGGGGGGQGARCDGSSNGAQGGGGGGHSGNGGAGGEGEYFGGTHCTSGGGSGTSTADSNTYNFFFGAGGGSGGCGTGLSSHGGGSGGSSILFKAYNISISGVSINMTGSSTSSEPDSEYGGSGGGSGGTILFNGSIINLDSSQLKTIGGSGGASTSPSVGGGGGGGGSGGRIKIFYFSLINTSNYWLVSGGGGGASTEGSAGSSGSLGTYFSEQTSEWVAPEPLIESNYTNPRTNIQYGNTFNITATASSGSGGEIVFYWYVTKPDGTLAVNNQTSTGCVNNDGISNKTCWSPSTIITGTSNIGLWKWNYTARDLNYGETTISGSFEVKGTSKPNIYSPLNNSITGSNSEVFLCSGSTSPYTTIYYEFYLDTISGTTLVQNSSLITYTMNLSAIKYKQPYYWKCRANINGQTNQSDFTNLFTFYADRRALINETTTYQNPSEESDTIIFYSNVTLNDLYVLDLSSATLTYNSTNYTTTIIKINNSLYKVSSEVSLPIVSITGTIKTFNWTYNFYTNEGNFESNVSQTYSHTINKLSFAECTSGTNMSLNFSFWKEQIPNKNLTASSFKATFEIWKTGGASYSTYNYDLINVSTLSFCIPEGVSYLTNTIIEYQVSENDVRHYYLRNNNLSNSIQQIKLFNLDISLGSGVKIIVEDSSGIPKNNVYGYIQRYDAGTGTYYSIAMIRTDINGEDYTFLRLYDAWYRFIVFDSDGIVLYTSNPKILSSTTETITISEITSGLLYNYMNGVAKSLIWNNITSSFIATWLDTTGRVTEANLLVYKRTGTKDYTVCDTSLYSASGTISCSGINATGMYIAIFKTDNGIVDLTTLYREISSELENLVGKNGLIVTLMLALVLFFIGAWSFSLSAGVIGGMLALGLSKVAGWLPLSWYYLIGIFFVGGVVAYYLRD